MSVMYTMATDNLCYFNPVAQLLDALDEKLFDNMSAHSLVGLLELLSDCSFDVDPDEIKKTHYRVMRFADHLQSLRASVTQEPQP